MERGTKTIYTLTHVHKRLCRQYFQSSIVKQSVGHIKMFYSSQSNLHVIFGSIGSCWPYTFLIASSNRLILQFRTIFFIAIQYFQVTNYIIQAKKVQFKFVFSTLRRTEYLFLVKSGFTIGSFDLRSPNDNKRVHNIQEYQDQTNKSWKKRQLHENSTKKANPGGIYVTLNIHSTPTKSAGFYFHSLHK